MFVGNDIGFIRSSTLAPPWKYSGRGARVTHNMSLGFMATLPELDCLRSIYGFA